MASLLPFDHLYLMPFRTVFCLPSLSQLFKPMLHIILLIWKNSKHYNTPARLVVLMREICNSLIIQACKYSSGEQIFTLIEQEDAAKAVDQLKTTLLVCGTFKSTYFDYKATANAECPANPWRIQVLFLNICCKLRAVLPRMQCAKKMPVDDIFDSVGPFSWSNPS